jgi:Cu/Ag efflux protein CusF
MKKLALMFSALLVVAGVASASQATAPARSTKATMKTHVVEAQVVSTDPMAKTLTVKTEQGESTMKVDGPAATHLKGLKAGEKVRLTCRDNAAGEHEAITHIVVEKATAKK